MRHTQKRRGASRKTQKLFDLVFKLLLQDTSSIAVVGFINGLFGRNYPPESDVSFGLTESVVGLPKALKNLLSDKILLVNGDPYLIEAQIDDDESIGARVAQYSMSYALQKKTGDTGSADNGETVRITTLKLCASRIIYWENGEDTPDKELVRLIVPDNAALEYEVKALKVQEKSPKELADMNLCLLLPFTLLRFRRQLKRRRTTAETRRKLAADFERLLDDIEALISDKAAAGLLNNSDLRIIMERIAQMSDELYGEYEEFKEVDMTLEEKFKSPLVDAIKLNRQYEKQLADNQRRIAEYQRTNEEYQRAIADLQQQLAAR